MKESILLLKITINGNIHFIYDLLSSRNMFLLFVQHSDEGWLHKAVEVEGHLHIIEELQLFDDPQPVDSLVISAKQVKSLTIACIRTHPSNRLHPRVFTCALLPPDVCVRGLAVGSAPAAALLLQQVHFLLRLHLCPRPSLRLERRPVCGRHGAGRQVGGEGRMGLDRVMKLLRVSSECW